MITHLAAIHQRKFCNAHTVAPSDSSCADGFTILEVVVAMGMLGVVLVSTGNAFVSISGHNSAMELRSAAINAAQMTLDDLRQQSPTSLPDSGSATPVAVTVENKDFTILVHFCRNAAFCTSASTRHIVVEVEHKAKEVFSVETVYTQLR